MFLPLFQEFIDILHCSNRHKISVPLDSLPNKAQLLKTVLGFKLRAQKISIKPTDKIFDTSAQIMFS